MWSSYKFEEITTRYGDESVPKLLQTALISATPELDEEIALKMATRMTKKLLRSEAGMDSGLARVFSTDQKDVLRDILIDEDILDAEDADRLLSLFDKPRAGISSRAKKRLKIDINSEINLQDGNIIRVKDLMERDAEQVFSSYVTQMEGTYSFSAKGDKIRW